MSHHFVLPCSRGTLGVVPPLRLLAAIFVSAVLIPSGFAEDIPESSGSNVASLPEIVVTGTSSQDGSANEGYRVKAVEVGPLGSVSLQDTPFSINVASAALIENLQAQSTTSALKTDPTVAFSLPENRASSYFMIRGFLNDQYALDGMRNPNTEWEPVEDKERIEVMNGADSFLYGITDPGGIVNYVLKRPPETPLLNVTVGDYGGDQAYTHIDAGGPLDKDGKFGYRLNLLYVDDGNTGTDWQTDERYLASGAFDWHIGPDTLLSIDAADMNRDYQGYQAFFRLGNITRLPSAPDPSKNYGEPYADSTDTCTRAGIELTSKLNDIFTIRSAFRYSLVEDRQVNIQNEFIDNQGDYNQTPSWAGWNPYRSLTYQGHLYVDAAFDTGSLEHKVTIGVSDDQTNLLSDFSSTSVSVNIPPTFISRLSHPVYYLPYPGTVTPWNTDGPRRTIEETNFLNTLLADTITITPQWSLMLGGNYAAVSDKNWDPATGAPSPANDKGAWTPSAALMFKPIPTITTYVSYIEGLTEGETAPVGTANANEVLAPYVSNQVEVGAKATFGKMNLDCALFRIDNAFAYIDPSDNVFKANGREVHMGGELVGSGKLTDDLTLIGGVTLLDATIADTAPGDPSSGKTPDAVPEQMARLYAEYSPPILPGFTLTGGIYYTGREYVDQANTNSMSIPSAITGDVGARYKCRIKGHDVTFRMDVNNVTDNAYWSTWQGGRVYVSDPRTFSFSVEIAWF